jgi:CheY-like chemotaxis protein
MKVIDENFTPTVLVVDDNALARSVIVKAMVEIGVNIIEADSGIAALSILKQQPVNLIVSDLVMPKMSGLMLLHTLLEQGQHLPFILVTSYSDKESAIQALRLGAFDYLEKPIDIGDLKSVAKEAIGAGLEQQSILSLVKTEGHNKESFALAEMQILRMRTFRAKSAEFDNVVAKGNIENWNDLRNLFVSETEQQLAYCAGTVESLASSSSQAQDLGFVLRSVQSVRLASESVRVTDISEFAWSVELTLAALKSNPEAIVPDTIKLVKSALDELKSKVINLINPDSLRIQKNLEQVTRDIRDKETQTRNRNKTSA